MEAGIGRLIVAMLFVLVLLPAFRDLLRKEKKHMEISGGVVNYDITFREFWYVSEKPAAEILEILSSPGTYEGHTYRFARDTMVLSLTSTLLGDTTKYILVLYPQETGTQICLYRKEGNHRTNKVGIDLVFFENLFCKEILYAIPIPYGKRKV